MPSVFYNWSKGLYQDLQPGSPPVHHLACLKTSVIFHLPKKTTINILNEYRLVALTLLAIECFAKLVRGHVISSLPPALHPQQSVCCNPEPARAEGSCAKLFLQPAHHTKQQCNILPWRWTDIKQPGLYVALMSCAFAAGAYWCCWHVGGPCWVAQQWWWHLPDKPTGAQVTAAGLWPVMQLSPFLETEMMVGTVLGPHTGTLNGVLHRPWTLCSVFMWFYISLCLYSLQRLSELMFL